MAPAAPLSDPAIEPELFRAVIGSFATGVCIVTATDAGEALGTTVSAVASVTLEPPTLLACLNRESATGRAIGRAGRFAVNVLAAHQADLAGRFATKTPSKFGDIPLVVTEGDGPPLIADVIAHLECRVVESVESGTHFVYFGRVIRGVAMEGEPLAYFRGGYGQFLERATGEA